MAYTFLKAQGAELGNRAWKKTRSSWRKQLLQEAKAHKVKFLLPVDHIVAEKIDLNAVVHTVSGGQHSGQP